VSPEPDWTGDCRCKKFWNLLDKSNRQECKMSKHSSPQQEATVPARKPNHTERSLLGYGNDELKLINEFRRIHAWSMPNLA
jgi:hypothetical protein